MSEVIKERVRKAKAKTPEDEKLVLQQIIQELALLALWRSKFFEYAAFYGGTSLRILYGLNRFSEDLDFTLLQPNKDFDPKKYIKAIELELQSFGFKVATEVKRKRAISAVQSAFVKADTQVSFIIADSQFVAQKGSLIKVKFEIDTDAVPGFATEARQVFWPQPFSILACDLPSLMAGKLHAAFCRSVRQNVKGRDWYDLFWYVGRGVQPNWRYLEEKVTQSGHWQKNKPFSPAVFKSWALKKIESIDADLAKKDVERFIEDQSQLAAWSTNLFRNAIEQLSG